MECFCGVLSREDCEDGYKGDVDEHPDCCMYIRKLWVTEEEKKEIDKDYEES